MEQLSGLDTAFVHQDSARTPMHVTAVLIYERGKTALTADRLKQQVENHLLSQPLFQRKLQRVPLDMDTPYWIPAGTTDWHYHLTELDLPGDANWQDFQQVLQQQHSRRMDLHKPLWRLHLIDGIEGIPNLPGQYQALLFKAHHAAVDGISLARVLSLLHSDNSQCEPQSRGNTPRPNQWDVWARANRNNLNRQFKLAETMGRLLPGLMRAKETRYSTPEELPPPLRGRARFNDQVSGRRSAGVLLVTLDDMKRIKRAIRRVTYNDVASSIIAGALRIYLEPKGELPEKTLACGMPINLRGTSENDPASNKIATMAVGLGTDIGDPVERVRAIHRYAVAAKKEINALGTGTVMDISDSIAPPVLAEGIRTLAWASRVAPVPIPYHTMISNVPGPEGHHQLAESPLVACAGLGPVRDNMGLFHIISNTRSHYTLSFNACRKLLPDGEHYLSCLEQALEELLRATADMRH